MRYEVRVPSPWNPERYTLIQSTPFEQEAMELAERIRQHGNKAVVVAVQAA